MRFFSADWHAFDDEIKTQRVVAAYNAFLSGLGGAVGQKIRNFVNTHSAHDALLDRLEVDANRRVIQFDLVAGDNQVGYFHLRLRYAGARLVTTSMENLSNALDSRRSVLLYDEFDVVDGASLPAKYIHRFLLWPRDRKEFEIVFMDFDLVVIPLKVRCYENHGETLVVVS